MSNNATYGDRDEDMESDDIEGKEKESRANLLVRENLHNLRLYRIDSGLVNMYFVGQTQMGNWMIIRTQAAET